jgi:esterase/lipase
MGSSLGGLIALKAAILAPVDAVVAISSPSEFEDVHLSDSELGGLKAPKLFVISDANEPFTSDTQHMFDMTPTPKDIRTYPGRIHGIRLFEGVSGVDLWPALLGFLQRYASAT